MSKIHSVKLRPGSEKEAKFMEILKEVHVEPNAVMCRLGLVFGTPYNEYILSDGLYQQIRVPLEKLREI